VCCVWLGVLVLARCVGAWWVGMVERFVCVIRVPVCARAPRVCPVCVPAPPVFFFIGMYRLGALRAFPLALCGPVHSFKLGKKSW
jgi:hypothetical protein